MQLKKIRPRVGVERAFVSHLQQKPFQRRSELCRGTVSKFAQGLLRAAKVDRGNQQVKVRKAAQAYISVNLLRENGSFIWNGTKFPSLKVLHDPGQFSGKPQAPPQVRLIRQTQPLLDFRGQRRRMFYQVTGNDRKNAVVLSEAEKFRPVHLCRIAIRDALDLLRRQLDAKQCQKKIKFPGCPERAGDFRLFWRDFDDRCGSQTVFKASKRSGGWRPAGISLCWRPRSA